MENKNEVEKILSSGKYWLNKLVGAKVKVIQVSLFHIKTIQFLIEDNKEAIQLSIKCDYCYSYCGRLDEWDEANLELSYGQEILEIFSRKIAYPFFMIKDKNSNFYIKSKYVLFERYDNSFHNVITKPHPKKINNENVEEKLRIGNELLEKWKGGKLEIWNSDLNKITLHIEKEFLTDELHNKKKLLQVECYSPSFLSANFMTSVENDLQLEFEKNMYKLYKLSKECFIECIYIELHEKD